MIWILCLFLLSLLRRFFSFLQIIINWFFIMNRRLIDLILLLIDRFWLNFNHFCWFNNNYWIRRLLRDSLYLDLLFRSTLILMCINTRWRYCNFYYFFRTDNFLLCFAGYGYLFLLWFCFLVILLLFLQHFSFHFE